MRPLPLRLPQPMALRLPCPRPHPTAHPHPAAHLRPAVPSHPTAHLRLAARPYPAAPLHPAAPLYPLPTPLLLTRLAGLEAVGPLPHRRVIARTPHPLPHLSLHPHPVRPCRKSRDFLSVKREASPPSPASRRLRLLRLPPTLFPPTASPPMSPLPPRQSPASSSRISSPICSTCTATGATCAFWRSGCAGAASRWRFAGRAMANRSTWPASTSCFWAVAPTASSALHRASSCACATSFARTWRTAACCWPSAGAIKFSGESGCSATKWWRGSASST